MPSKVRLKKKIVLRNPSYKWTLIYGSLISRNQTHICLFGIDHKQMFFLKHFMAYMQGYYRYFKGTPLSPKLCLGNPRSLFFTLPVPRPYYGYIGTGLVWTKTETRSKGEDKQVCYKFKQQPTYYRRLQTDILKISPLYLYTPIPY